MVDEKGSAAHEIALSPGERPKDVQVLRVEL